MKIYALVVSLCMLGVASAGMAAGAGGGGGGHGGGSGYAGGVRPGSHGPGAANSFAATSNGLAGSAGGGSPAVSLQRGDGAVPPRQTRAQMARALTDLRVEGLKLQRQDGGKLTQEHRALLQARLNTINKAPATAH